MKAQATLTVEIEVVLNDLYVDVLAESEVMEVALNRLDDKLTLLDHKRGRSGDLGYVRFIDRSTACLTNYGDA